MSDTHPLDLAAITNRAERCLDALKLGDNHDTLAREDVPRMVAEIERLQDPEVMLAALIDSGWLHTETHRHGDSATIRTTLRYYGQRIIDERPA